MGLWMLCRDTFVARTNENFDEWLMVVRKVGECNVGNIRYHVSSLPLANVQKVRSKAYNVEVKWT